MSLRRFAKTLFGLLAGPFLFACNETTIEVELHALQASGKVAFVCRADDGMGRDRSLCPDYEDNGRHRMFALVTQTSTEEVAVIDTFEAAVVDLDPSAPGYSFLRVPSRPGDIAATPGGAATFVALTGVGKEGITGIPTTCIGPPKKNETARDVTTFPSCHLPAAPGDITVLVAPPEADGTIRESCDPNSAVESEQPPGARVAECAANLTLEHQDDEGNIVGPIGRRKIAVALPTLQEIAIIDGQWLLDQVPGSFPRCRIETTLKLGVDLGPAGTKQRLDDAPELELAPGCELEQPVAPPRPSSFTPLPAGFGPAGDVLYVADQGAPVVHVLDVSNPCAPRELPSLLPMSFERPERDVTTSRVAASPLTPDGQRFVYAVDPLDQPAASLMAFDVSPGSTNRTPLVRPGALRIPEPPDRLRLGSPIADVAFALRDLETTDPDTGIAESGVKCDPNPDSDPTSPGALHRPTSDESRGAQARLLRGLFGLAMLTSGHVAIIDVDDFDAPCRRPTTTNPGDDEDFRGCRGDTGLPEFLTLDKTATGSPTVTNEVSCNAVAPHRFRSALLNKTSSSDGTGSAALVAFPEFTVDADEVDLDPVQQPKLLAVPFEPASRDGVPPEPQVYVGTTLHTKGNPSADLATDPNTARISSLTLPFVEPRAFPAGEAINLIFEGPITGQFPNGSIVYTPEDPYDPGMRLVDAAAQFCDRGVYDHAMLAELGDVELGIEDAEARDLFARTHADAVEVTSPILPVTDVYWTSERLIKPDDPLTPNVEGCGLSYNVCYDTFGEYEPLDLNPNRELSIVRAYQDRLDVEPQDVVDEAARTELKNRLDCCFPQGLQYRVHVRNQWILLGTGTRQNDVNAFEEPLPDGSVHFRCRRDCDPTKKYLNGRVFEVASSVDCSTGACGVGQALPGDPCSYDPARADGGLRLPGASGPEGEFQEGDTDAISCIHSGVTSRFAVYRGLAPSVRGMTFSWQTTGGFRPLLASIAAVSILVSPQHIQYVPELQRIAIVDGAQLGLTLVSLDSLRVEDPWPVY